MTIFADPHIETPAPAVYTTEIEDPDFKVNLAVNYEARVLVFHNKQFRKKLSWLEFDLNRNRLDFVMNDGDVRNFGIPVAPDMAKYMQNAFQVMVILMNEATGEPEAGNYFPLIIHRA